MSIRDALRKREAAREEAMKNGGGAGPSDLPEGVGRYIKNSELRDGRTFIILDDPDDWFFYYVHEDSDFATRQIHVKKHSCLHSPRKLDEEFDKYSRPGKIECISCRAGIRRRLYFLIRLFDVEYGTWRIFDAKEFHAQNLVNDYDKLEKAARKFNKAYTLVGDSVVIKKADKSFALESSDIDEETHKELFAKARELIQNRPDYAELANFRSEEDLRKIIAEADEGHADKSVLDSTPNQTTQSPQPNTNITNDLPF